MTQFPGKRGKTELLDGFRHEWREMMNRIMSKPELALSEGDAGGIVVQPRVVKALLINPEQWTSDIWTSFAPHDVIPHGAILSHEKGHAVVLIQTADACYVDLPQANGMAQIPMYSENIKKWQWLKLGGDVLTGTWRYFPVSMIHGGQEEGKPAKEKTISQFLKDSQAGNITYDLVKMSPFSYGADLQLEEYKRQRVFRSI